jgi:hypothetical protein
MKLGQVAQVLKELVLFGDLIHLRYYHTVVLVINVGGALGSDVVYKR